MPGHIEDQPLLGGADDPTGRFHCIRVDGDRVDAEADEVLGLHSQATVWQGLLAHVEGLFRR